MQYYWRDVSLSIYCPWFNADAISSLHFFEIDTGRKPVFWTLWNYITNSRIWNDFQISSHYMTGCRIHEFGIFTISRLRRVCMNVKIRNKFIEIKYSVSYGLVIFITNYRWFRILEISRYRRSNGSVLKDTRCSRRRNRPVNKNFQSSAPTGNWTPGLWIPNRAS